MTVENISRLKFEAMIFIREPHAPLHFEEVEWFEAYHKLIAFIARSKEDNDYSFIIFARDERKMFRFHYVAPKFFSTQARARSALMNKLEPYAGDGMTYYEASPIKRRITDLFVPSSRVTKFNNFFTILTNDKNFEAAKNIIEIAAYTYFDSDGNFIKDFQTTEFNSRLWELFLHIYFSKRGFKRDLGKTVPDFNLNFYEQTLAVEAVTVNENEAFDERNPKDLLEIHQFTQDYMPIKYHRTLIRKLQKKYHLLPHLVGIPLLFAVHDYHIEGSGGVMGSMVWTRQALMEYLYGHRQICKVVDNEMNCEEVDKPFEKINGHHWKGASAPSGFFDLPDAEHISGVLFASNATLPTFNRMGKLAGLGSAGVKIIRNYLQFNPLTQNIEFKSSNVDDPAYEEDWGDSVAIFHNHRAKVPLDKDLFTDASHFYFDPSRKGIYILYGRRYTPASMSQVFIPKL